MKLLEALEKYNIRVSGDNKRWMVLDDGWFYVYERLAYKKRATIIISTQHEDNAVSCLLGE
jgi:hypothetical protein